ALGMNFDVLTIFPQLIEFYIKESIIKRAIDKELISVSITNIRDFTHDKHKSVDDAPYGGGVGMVLRIEPIYYALEKIKSKNPRKHTVLLTPQGELFTQSKAHEFFSNYPDGLILICGRYEGIDERVRSLADEELSIGEYVLTGGELAALIIIDAVKGLVLIRTVAAKHRGHKP
ncbi:tRNA (guanine-N(1)-)-methyltransferase, partial [Candidatus Magnetoovum chiemensis]